MKPTLHLGCTLARHRRLGIHAVVNARGGQQWRNDDTQQEIEMLLDAQNVRRISAERVRVYQFGSRPFRRRLSRLLSQYDD